MNFGATAQILWIVAVVAILAAIWYFKRRRQPPDRD